MRRSKASGLPNRRRSRRARARPRRRPRRRCPRLPCRRRSPRWRRARAGVTSTGRPRMARACRANSLWYWVARVTRPVSCGRGLTSENQTSSPFTNSSTPKMPRPPSASVTLPAISRRLGQRGRAHRLRLPALDIVALDLAVADRLAEAGDDLAVAPGCATVSRVISKSKSIAALDDDARLLDPAALQGVVPGRGDLVRRSRRRTGPCRTSTSPASRNRGSRRPAPRRRQLASVEAKA